MRLTTECLPTVFSANRFLFTCWRTCWRICSLACLLAFPQLALAAEVDCFAISQAEHKQIAPDLTEYAMQGSPEAQFEIGLLFEYGRGVAQHDSIARCWYEHAAAQKNPDAQYRLAVLFDNGWGVIENKIKAFRFYKSAARVGHVMAQHDVAMMYFYGLGTSRNLIEAYRWLKMANLSRGDLMTKHLNMVTAEMTPYEIQLAEFLISQSGDEIGI